jgi:hypothetical protein
VICKNRHAWSESPFKDIGWIRFDATGSDSLPPEPPEPTKTPTITEITSMDLVGVKGDSFNVKGTVTERMGEPLDGLDVIIYISEVKNEAGIICGETTTIDGVFDIDCLIPLNMSEGYFHVQAKCLGSQEYNSSLSDPPLKIISKTEATLKGPPKVIEGREFTVRGNLTHWETGEPISYSECKIIYEGTENAAISDKDGHISVTLNPDPPGTHTVTLSYSGSEFKLPSNTSINTRVIPLTITPDHIDYMVRGETITIEGIIHAEDLAGDDEKISIHINDTHIGTTESNIIGRFSQTYDIPSTTNLEKVVISFTLENGYTKNLDTNIVARTALNIAPSEPNQNKGTINATATLLDDLGTPLTNKTILWETMLLGERENYTLATDEKGQTTTTIDLTPIKGNATLILITVYAGERHYLPAAEKTSIPFIVQQQTASSNTIFGLSYPVFFAILFIILAAITGGYYYLRKYRTQKKEPILEGTEQLLKQDITNSGYRINFPQIKPPFPRVWGINEPLLVELEIIDDTLEPSDLILKYNSNKENLKTDGKKVRTTMIFNTPGIHPIQLYTHKDQDPVSRVNIKIVDYREEIIDLYKKWTKKYVDKPDKKLTARDFLIYLHNSQPELDINRIEKSITIFEIADYSLHDLFRRDYETFYLNHKTIGEEKFEE